MTAATLLPSSATTTEIAADVTVGTRLEAIESDGVRTINDATACPAGFLPFLAWARSADVWGRTWSEASQRAVIAEALAIHRIKGTPASVLRALALVGITAEIQERIGARRYDGKTLFDGTAVYGPAGGWALYRVKLKTPIRNDQVEMVRAILEMTAPKRCELYSLDYREAVALYDGTIRYDGAYNFGEAK